MQDNHLSVYQPSQNRGLSTALLSLEERLRDAAASNVRIQIGEDSDYTGPEIHAMTIVEELKLVNGMDLAAILLRYKLVKQIETEALWTVHPGQYDSRDAMARDQGISPSELSDIMTMGDVIFPYIEEHLGIPVAAIWEQIGKSNFRDLCPILKYIITGERPNRSNQSSDAADALLDDVAATAHAAGQTLTETEMLQQAVGRLMEAGRLTNREMRAQIRPERTESISATVVTYSGRKYLLAELSADQETLVTRRLGQYIDPVYVSLPADQRQRQIEAARAPVLGTLLRDFSG